MSPFAVDRYTRSQAQAEAQFEEPRAPWFILDQTSLDRPAVDHQANERLHVLAGRVIFALFMGSLAMSLSPDLRAFVLSFFN